MFKPGDFVKLNNLALTESIKHNGKLFPGLTQDSILKVGQQKGHSVYTEDGRIIHDSWFRFATVDEIESITGA